MYISSYLFVLKRDDAKGQTLATKMLKVIEIESKIESGKARVQAPLSRIKTIKAALEAERGPQSVSRSLTHRMRLFEVIVLASVIANAKASFVSGPRPLWYPIPLSGRSLTDQPIIPDRVIYSRSTPIIPKEEPQPQPKIGRPKDTASSKDQAQSVLEALDEVGENRNAHLSL